MKKGEKGFGTRVWDLKKGEIVIFPDYTSKYIVTDRYRSTSVGSSATADPAYYVDRSEIVLERMDSGKTKGPLALIFAFRDREKGGCRLDLRFRLKRAKGAICVFFGIEERKEEHCRKCS